MAECGSSIVLHAVGLLSEAYDLSETIVVLEVKDVGDGIFRASRRTQNDRKTGWILIGGQ